MTEPTDADRERAMRALNYHVRWVYAELDASERAEVDGIAVALAEQRERARAPFLAYADKCAAIGADRKAPILKRAVNRSVAKAIRRAAGEEA